MSYIVCKNCKKILEVADDIPLNFHKCEDCGHVLKFAGDANELNCIINDIEIPEITYEKICSSCKSLNPRQTGACLFCGATDFQYQYDADSVRRYNESVSNLKNPTQIVVTKPLSGITSSFFKIISILVGVFDFLFFFFIGVEYTIGIEIAQQNPMAVAMQNSTLLSLILFSSLILAGFLVSFVLPRVSYKEVFKISSCVGIIVGCVALVSMGDILLGLVAVLIFGVASGFGGFLGELLVHKILKHANK